MRAPHPDGRDGAVREARRDLQRRRKTPDSRLNACGWDYDYPDNSSHLLQLVVYDSDIAYSQDPASTPFAIGDKGNVTVSNLSGVDVMWVQKGKTYSLSYFTTGPSAVPDDTTKAEQVKALAKTIASQALDRPSLRRYRRSDMARAPILSYQPRRTIGREACLGRPTGLLLHESLRYRVDADL